MFQVIANAVVGINGYDDQYPFDCNQFLASYPLPKLCPVNLLFTKLTKEPSVLSTLLQNPTDVPETSPVPLPQVLPEPPSCAITYPKLSSGPLYHSSPVLGIFRPGKAITILPYLSV